METQVYLLERKPLIRDNIRGLLRNERSVKIFAEDKDLGEARHKAFAKAEVLLVEFVQPASMFFERVAALKKQYPALKIIVMSCEDDSVATLRTMLQSGASGYLTINASTEELTHAIRKVMGDGTYVCTAFALRQLKNAASASVSKKLPPIMLSRGEHEVLALVAEGLTNQEIAQQLFVSVRTVENRRQKLLEKTDTVNTATLIKFAMRHGLIS